MHISQARLAELNEKCRQYRIELLKLLHSIQTGHPGGSLSCMEIVTTLYEEVMNVNPQNPHDPDRDRFVLSKGHCAPTLYLNLAHKGFFPVDDLPTLRQIDSHLQGHPCAHKTPGIDFSTGPLGLGFSGAIGMALAARVNGRHYYTYTLLGDGEIQEGGVWEAAMSASKFKTDNLIAILDLNGVQLDGTTEEIMPMGDVSAKFRSFGWNTIEINGHDISAICDAVAQAKAHKGQPTMIVAHTVKGKGVSFMEGKSGWHGKAIGDADLEAALKELEVQA
ncbi:MAG: transketolase [Oscillospiraceae bacterium]